MAEIDTSSYPKPTAPASPLDIAGKLGGLQSQALQINQQKLSQANEALTYLTRAMTAIGPDGSKDQYKRAGADAVNAGLAPPNMLGIWNKKIDDAPSPRTFFDEAMTAAAQHQEVFNYHLGQVKSTDTGQGIRLDQIPGKGGPGIPRAFVPKDIPPTERIMGPDNTPTLQGNQPQLSAPGIDQPISRRLPVAPPLPPGPMNPAMVPGMRPGERATAAEVMPATTPGGPTGPVVGTPPDYDPGLKQFAADQDLAANKLTAIKPAIQAFPLLKGLTTGIGTETYNKALAGLSNLGWLPQGMTDKVTAYQIVNKKIADYLRTNPIGQRSDAAQALSQSASPDPKGQINQALVKLLPDAVALDRAQALRSISFANRTENKNGDVTHEMRRDYHNYGNHRATLPANLDERALTIDFLPDEKRNELLDEMKKKQNTVQGKKFKYTLELAERAGLFDTK